MEEQDQAKQPHPFFVSAPFVVLVIMVVLMVLTNLPLLGGLPLSLNKTLVLAGGLIISFVIFIIGRLIEGVWVYPKSVVGWGALAVLVATGISTIASPQASVSFSGLGTETGTFLVVLMFMSALFLAAHFLQSVRRVSFLKGIIGVSIALLVVIEAIKNIFGVAPGFFGGSLTAIGKTNDAATLYAFGMLMAILAVYFSPTEKRAKVWPFVLGVLSFVGLLFSDFSLIWIMLAVVTAFVFVYRALQKGDTTASPLIPPSFWDKTKSFVGRGGVVLALGTVVFVLLFIFGQPGSKLSSLTNRLVPVPTEARPAWSSTATVLFDTIKSRPLVGTGPNRFVSAWIVSKPLGINSTPFWAVDFNQGVGYVPTFFVTTGLLGVLAWLSLILLFAQFLWKAFRAPLEVARKNVLISTALLAIFGWIVMIFYIPDLPILCIVALLSGATIALATKFKIIQTGELVFKRTAIVNFLSTFILTVLGIGALSLGFLYIQHARALSIFTDAVNSPVSATSTALLRRAIAIDAQDVYYRALGGMELSDLSLKLSATKRSADELRTLFISEFSQVTDAGLAAIAYDKTNYQNYLSLGQAYAAIVPVGVSGAYERAKEEFELAAKYNPTSPVIPFNLAQLELAVKNTEKAKAYLAESLGKKPNYLQALYVKSQLAVLAGDIKDAIADAEKAVLTDPNDPRVLFELGYLKYRNADYKDAAAILSRAVLIFPNFANAHYFLGLTADKLGQPSAALAEFKTVLSLNPGNALVGQIIENLTLGKHALSGIPGGETTQGLPVLEE